MYIKIVVFLAVLLFTGCSFHEDIYLPSTTTKEIQQKDISITKEPIKAKKRVQVDVKSVDWAGYYYGVLPCENCSGVETWLHLDEYDNKGVYELSENYLQITDGVFETQGDLVWKDDLVAKMSAKDEKRYIFVGKNSVTFMNTLNEALQNVNTLKKLDTFAGNGQQLLVLPNSIQKGTIENQKALIFHALVNFEHANEQGYKSLKASYGIECQANTYSILKALYFKGRFATNSSQASPKMTNIHFQNKDDVVWQAKEKYCK